MRSVEEIYAQMREDMEERCGFQPEDSCDLAVRLYAAAAQIQALEMQADWVLDQSFPQTAQGVYLERHAAMRGLTRIAGTCAEGTLRFSVDLAPASDLTIPQGTVCMTAEEIRFETTAAGSLKAGELSVDIPARAVESGASGNAAPDTITILTACPIGVTHCTNPKAFSGGSDPEDDESLRSRVLESYQRLPNGANAAWYEKTAMSHAGVVAAAAVGRAQRDRDRGHLYRHGGGHAFRGTFAAGADGYPGKTGDRRGRKGACSHAKAGGHHHAGSSGGRLERRRGCRGSGTGSHGIFQRAAPGSKCASGRAEQPGVFPWNVCPTCASPHRRRISRRSKVSWRCWGS